MNSIEEQLEVVSEDDEVIGLETRRAIHEKGLLHREIQIWFITPKRQIVFQRRSKDKDTFPDKLDASVAGHVEPGMSYQDTALKECQEETGIRMETSKLHFVAKLHTKIFDEVTGTTNNTLRAQYAYLFEDGIESLRTEAGEATGFELWDIETLRSLSQADRAKFIPLFLTQEYFDVYAQAQEVLKLI